jgi:alpha-1,2-mannosyltransferase
MTEIKQPGRETEKRRGLRPLLVAVAIAVLASAYVFHIRKDMTDFGVCYQAGGRIVQGETLYREADGHLQFKYSPAAAVFFAPLALLPYEAAKVAWYVLEIAFLAAIFLIFHRMLALPGKRAASVLIWTFLIELKFLGRELELGQVNLLILFALTLMIYCLFRRRETRAGWVWGGSLIFKPYALVFLPYFLVKRRFRALITGLAVPALGLVIPAIFYGIRGNFRVLGEWPETLSKSTAGLLAAYDNASLYGFLLKALPGVPGQMIKVIFLAAFAGLAAVVLWLMRAGRRAPSTGQPEVLECAFLFILIPLFSPLGWNYNYLYSLPAVMLIVSAWDDFSKAGRVVLAVNFITIGTSLVELWGRELFHFYTNTALVVLNFLIVLIALAYLRTRAKA